MVPALGILVASTGAAGVLCSAMIYVFTRRELWSLERTVIRFALTTAVLGIGTTWLCILLIQRLVDPQAATQLVLVLGPPLTKALMAASLLKLAFDALTLRALTDLRLTSMKRTALLITGVLSSFALARAGLGILGGLALPLLVLNALQSGTAPELTIGVSMVLAWIACLGGELLERYLFFAAAAPPRMPGGVRP
jgi:formate dehydrogenase iron-sulfur subunit